MAIGQKFKPPITDLPVKDISASFSSLGLITTDMDISLRSDVSGGTLDTREELASAVRVALGTDRLVDAEEVLPDPDSTDRRGWWGDMDAEIVWDGWPIGVKNWLLTRAKISDNVSWEGDTVERARTYTQSALQPLIDRRIASQISVSAQRIAANDAILNQQLNFYLNQARPSIVLTTAGC
jgi:phage gp46-like protein